MKDGVILIYIYPNISLEGKSLSQCPGVTVIAMIEGLWSGVRGQYKHLSYKVLS